MGRHLLFEADKMPVAMMLMGRMSKPSTATATGIC